MPRWPGPPRTEEHKKEVNAKARRRWRLKGQLLAARAKHLALVRHARREGDEAWLVDFEKDWV